MTKRASQQLNVGDWVRSYESGIWQVSRIESYFAQDRATGKEVPKTTVFSRKFVTESFKRSFKTDSCDLSFIEKLDAPTLQKLEGFISANESVYEAFREYVPEPIDLIYNARIAVPENGSVQDVETVLSGHSPLSEHEISEFLNTNGFNTKGVPFWTVQFVSRNYEIIDDYLVFRFLRVLE